MNELEIFNNPEFGQIRATEINGEPYFVGKDVCDAFGDTNYRRSLSKIDDSDKGVSQIATPGGKQTMTVINESGLYSLLFQMQPQKGNENEAIVNARIDKLHHFKQKFFLLSASTVHTQHQQPLRASSLIRITESSF